jgi:hypothetical protein
MGVGEASTQDVARRVMPCPLPTMTRLTVAGAVGIPVRVVGDQ